MEPSATQSSLGALVVAVGNTAIAFGAVGVTEATKIEVAIVGLIAVVFPFVRQLEHKTNTGAANR